MTVILDGSDIGYPALKHFIIEQIFRQDKLVPIQEVLCFIKLLLNFLYQPVNKLVHTYLRDIIPYPDLSPYLYTIIL